MGALSTGMRAETLAGERRASVMATLAPLVGGREVSKGMCQGGLER